METNIRAVVNVDGQPISFSSIQLSQNMQWHHSFEVKILLKESKGLMQDKADAYLGKAVTISFAPIADIELLRKEADVPTDFNGVITEIELDRINGGQLYLVLRGYSPSIYLDAGPNTRSFTDQGLKEIIDTIFKDAESAFSVHELEAAEVNPEYSAKLPYTVQYKESNFEFLCRLANRYGEWFFFDGLQFFFSKIDTEAEEVVLTFGKDLDDFDLSLRALPAKFKLRAYDYQKHDFPETEPQLSGMNKIAEKSYNLSKDELFKNVPMAPVIQSLDKATLDEMGNNMLKSISNDMFTLSGISARAELKVGSIVKIVSDHGLEGEEEHGKYIITNLSHSIDFDGGYRNVFEAIPAEALAPPANHRIKAPFCETQIAEVTEVNDEDKMGRVKVRFFWQNGTGEQSPWLRVNTLYSGADKGLYVLPEVGDQVLVDFEHHNPEKPYVLGGFYHGKAKPENFDPENNKKGFKTRAGNHITIDDKGGEETITIANPDSKNVIKLSMSSPSISIASEGGSISLSADSISLNAKDITLSASNSVNITGDKEIGIASQKISSDAEMEHSLSGTEMKMSAKAKWEATSNGQASIQSTADTTITALMIKLNS